MVAEPKVNNQVLERVVWVYEWLDVQLRQAGDLAGTCDICGKCCDFDSFGHRLFVTSPELIYLTANLRGDKLRPMTTGRCPYNIADKCTIHEHRFAGCRIFCCKGDKDFQSGLSESALKEFKSICTEFSVPYRYADLATALKSIAEP